MQEEGRLAAYLKTQLLIASSHIDELIERWEKTVGKQPEGVDGMLVANIRSKQREWVDRLHLKEPPPQGQIPLHPLFSLRSDILSGRCFALSEPRSELKYPTSSALHTSSFIHKQSAPLKALSAHAPAFVSKASKVSQLPVAANLVREASATLSDEASEGGKDKLKKEESCAAEDNSASDSQQMEEAAGAERQQAAEPVEEETMQDAGTSAEELEGLNAEMESSQEVPASFEAQPRLATPPGFESLRGVYSVEDENAESGERNPSEQRERRRQRLERKRRKESAARAEEGDGLPGSKAMFGSRQVWMDHFSREQIGGGESTEMGQESMQGALCMGGDMLRPQTGETSHSGWEEGIYEEEVLTGGYDSEGFPPGALGTAADFPVLSGGLQQAGEPTPPGEASKAPQQASTWAKHLSSRAEPKEGSAGQVAERSDEAFLEYMQKKQTFGEEDRPRRKRMRIKTDFECIERVKGRKVNTVHGLQLYEHFLDPQEQDKAIAMIKELERMGQRGELRGRTCSAPKKWMKGKGRVTMQFGCCYNYAVDKQGRPPGILQDEGVEPMPVFLEDILDRMVRWRVMPGGKRRPDSAIINLYSESDCIPIHIDHHDFDRPFCTISLLSVANIKFGAVMESLDAGQFTGAFELPLPTGSVCILQGNAADVAKHCIPSVRQARISVTFRRMKPDKAPHTNAVLPLPDYAVFHEHAFPPPLLPPISFPLPSFPAQSASPPRSETPPLDSSAEAWPDLSAGVSRASSSQNWSLNAAAGPPKGNAWPEFGMHSKFGNGKALPPSRPSSRSSSEARAVLENGLENTPPDTCVQEREQSLGQQKYERPVPGHVTKGQYVGISNHPDTGGTGSLVKEADPFRPSSRSPPSSVLSDQNGCEELAHKSAANGRLDSAGTVQVPSSEGEQMRQVARPEKSSDVDERPWGYGSEERLLVPSSVQRKGLGNGRLQSPGRVGINSSHWRKPESSSLDWRRGDGTSKIASNYGRYSRGNDQRRSMHDEEQKFAPSPVPQRQDGEGFFSGRAQFANRHPSEEHEKWSRGPHSDPTATKGRLVSAAEEYARGTFYSEQNGGASSNGTTSHEAPAGVRTLKRAQSGPGEYLHQLGMEARPNHLEYKDEYYHSGGRSSSGSESCSGGEPFPQTAVTSAQYKKIPVVDASYIFSDTPGNGKQLSSGKVVTSSAAVVASPSLAMFFPQEAPKKDLQEPRSFGWQPTVH